MRCGGDGSSFKRSPRTSHAMRPLRSRCGQNCNAERLLCTFFRFVRGCLCTFFGAGKKTTLALYNSIKTPQKTHHVAALLDISQQVYTSAVVSMLSTKRGL